MLLACRSWFFAMLSLISRIRLPRTIATSVSSLLNLPSVSIFCPIRRATSIREIASSSEELVAGLG